MFPSSSCTAPRIAFFRSSRLRRGFRRCSPTARLSPSRAVRTTSYGPTPMKSTLHCSTSSVTRTSARVRLEVSEETMMEFLVQFDVDVPDDVAESEVEDRERAEAAAAGVHDEQSVSRTSPDEDLPFGGEPGRGPRCRE